MADRDERAEALISRIRQNWPEARTMPMSMVIRVHRLRDLIWARQKEVVRQASLTWGEFEVLAALRSGKPPFRLTPSEIGGLVLLTSGGLTKIFHDLERAGLVRRRDNPDDARSSFVELSADGRRRIERLFADLDEISAPLFSEALSREEQAVFLDLLEKLLGRAGAAEPERRPARSKLRSD